MQYGIRLQSEDQDILYSEYLTLLSGLTDKTPLGITVKIRKERNQKIIRQFGQFERKVRSDWMNYVSSGIRFEDGVRQAAAMLKGLV